MNKYNYLLETQPASSAFSIGGICCMPVHGGRLGSSLISDTVTEIRFINESGNEIIKTENDENFDLYRLNVGIFGIITHITLKIIKIKGLKAETKTIYNIFNKTEYSGYKINRILLDDYIKEKIEKSLKNGTIEYNQCFVDFHNNCILGLDWKESEIDCKITKECPDITKITKYSTIDMFFSDLDKNYRGNQDLLDTAGKIIRYDICYNVEKNMQKNRDMFWVKSASRALFMSYFIPVYIEGIGMTIDNLYFALEYVMNLIEKYKKYNFNVDIPSDIRFVITDTKSRLSPLYNKKKIVYATIEILSGASNLETNSHNISYFDTELNRLFREFFHDIEKYLLKLDAKPHWAKIFGFSGEKLDAFGEEYIRNLLDFETKEKLYRNMNYLFTNKFIDNLTFINQI